MVIGFVCYTKINLLIRGFESLLFCMIQYHINEFKSRMIYAILSLTLTILLVWHYKQHIIFSLSPLNLIFTSLTEAFYLYIYFSILLAIITNIPYFYNQFYQFYIPGAYQYQIKYNNISTLLILWLAAITSTKTAIKIIFNFFIQFQSQYLNIALTFQHFIQFINQLIIIWIFIFITPIILKSFHHFFIKRRKILYWILATILAILTPPDLISLIITIIPLIIIVEIQFFFNSKSHSSTWLRNISFTDENRVQVPDGVNYLSIPYTCINNNSITNLLITFFIHPIGPSNSVYPTYNSCI